MVIAGGNFPADMEEQELGILLLELYTCGYQHEPKYSKEELLQIWALPVGGNQEPELPRAGVAWWCRCSLEIPETYHNAMQSFSSSSLFHHSLSGFGIRRQWAVWAKNLLYLFPLAPIKRTAAHFYSKGGPVWADIHISSCRTFPYSEQILGNQNRTRRLVIVSVRWSPFAAARLRLTCASRLSSAERRGDRTAR